MTIQIPLSLSGPADAFKAAVDAYRDELITHRSGAADVPAPIVNPLIDGIIQTVHRGDPLPDDFVIQPYEIVDDTPPPPTLAERKRALTAELYTAASAVRDAILSPARANLLNLDMGEALSVPEDSRTPAQVATIAAYVAFQRRSDEINLNAAHAAVDIEELTDATINAWKVPEL